LVEPASRLRGARRRRQADAGFRARRHQLARGRRAGHAPAHLIGSNLSDRGTVQATAASPVSGEHMYEEKFMRRAIDLSAEALATPGTEPFGAVIVRSGAIVGEGFNSRARAIRPDRPRRGRSDPRRVSATAKLRSLRLRALHILRAVRALCRDHERRRHHSDVLRGRHVACQPCVRAADDGGPRPERPGCPARRPGLSSPTGGFTPSSMKPRRRRRSLKLGHNNN
jgi:hypothetical protein